MNSSFDKLLPEKKKHIAERQKNTFEGNTIKVTKHFEVRDKNYKKL